MGIFIPELPSSWFNSAPVVDFPLLETLFVLCLEGQEVGKVR